MSGNGSFDHEQVLLGKDLQDFEVLDRDPLTTGASGHPHPLENLSGIGSGSDRTGSALAVVLTVGRIVDTAKTVSFDDPLETLSLGGTNGADDVTRFKNFTDGNNIADSFFNNIEITEFYNPFFRSGTGFVKMAEERLRSVFYFGITKSKLEGVVPIGFVRFDLGNNAGTGFYYRASNIVSSIIVDTGHADFFTD